MLQEEPNLMKKKHRDDEEHFIMGKITELKNEFNTRKIEKLPIQRTDVICQNMEEVIVLFEFRKSRYSTENMTLKKCQKNIKKSLRKKIFGIF